MVRVCKKPRKSAPVIAFNCATTANKEAHRDKQDSTGAMKVFSTLLQKMEGFDLNHLTQQVNEKELMDTFF